MKLTYLTSILFIWAIVFTSCSCEGEEDCSLGTLHNPNPVEIFDGAAYTQTLRECRLPRVQTFTASNITGATVTGNQGTTLFINPQTFDQDGIFVDGDVTVSLIEMYEPGEIVACHLSTNGINLSDNIEPLLSESIFYLDITFEGRPVNFLQPIRVFIPSENLGEQQFLYNSPSCPELECIVLWEEEITTNPVFEKPIIDAVGNKTHGYQTTLISLGWKNIGRYNTNESPRSTIYNKARVGYNGTNANVFVIYDDASRAIGLFDSYNENLEVYTEKFGQIPTGINTNVVFVTFQDGQFLYSTKTGVVEMDFLTATLETTRTNEEGFINALNSL